jgi:hypothetical protein
MTESDFKAPLIDGGETILIRCSSDFRKIDELTLSRSGGGYLSVDALRSRFVDYDKIKEINYLNESDSNTKNSRLHYGEYQRIVGIDVKLISDTGITLKSSNHRIQLTDIPSLLYIKLIPKYQEARSNKSQTSRMVCCLMFVALLAGVVLYFIIVNF